MHTRTVGGSEKFQDKQTFFYTEVKKLRPHTFRGDVCLTIDRSCLLNSVSFFAYPWRQVELMLKACCHDNQALQATRFFTVSDWYKKFNVEFKGEEGTLVSSSTAGVN